MIFKNILNNLYSEFIFDTIISFSFFKKEKIIIKIKKFSIFVFG